MEDSKTSDKNMFYPEITVTAGENRTKFVVSNANISGVDLVFRQSIISLIDDMYIELRKKQGEYTDQYALGIVVGQKLILSELKERIEKFFNPN